MNQDDKWTFDKEFFTEKMKVTLTAKEKINHDSYMFRFEFQDKVKLLGMNPASHIILKGVNNKNEEVGRKYTAVKEGPGYFQIPIKIYRPNSNPNFPEGGELTPYLEQVKLNTEFQIKRAIGKLFYWNKYFYLRPKENPAPKIFKQVFLICGGSGITPAYQLIHQICLDKTDETKIYLLYANRTDEDIWLKQEIDNLSHQNPEKFKVFYTLDKPSDKWTGIRGHVNLDMMKQVFPKPDETTLGVVCGPKPMNKLVLNLFEQFGLSQGNFLKF